MTTSELLRFRLRNHQITESRSREPQEIVEWMGAMQAQEYTMAKWAIGLRLPGVKDAEVEQAFNRGAILRTHVLRPTWHFVSPGDIRWLLALTAPRVHAANAYMYRKLELDAAVFKRSDATLVRALQAGRPLIRTVFQRELERVGIPATGLRLGYLMMHAELEGLVCSGPREGRQFTYALLDQRAPGARTLDRADALAKLSRRFFLSRGPATARDFSYWSGLTLTDAKVGVSSLGPEFVSETTDGRTYVFSPVTLSSRAPARATFLMPDYDEYGMSYVDREALLAPIPSRRKPRPGSFAYNRMIVVDGRIVGSWRRSSGQGNVTIETDYSVPMSRLKLRAVGGAIKRFTSFLGGSPEG